MIATDDSLSLLPDGTPDLHPFNAEDEEHEDEDTTKGFKTNAPAAEVADLETDWISPTANHPKELVDMLNYLFPHHRFKSTFQWSIAEIKPGKYILFITVLGPPNNYQ